MMVELIAMGMGDMETHGYGNGETDSDGEGDVACNDGDEGYSSDDRIKMLILSVIMVIGLIIISPISNQ